MKNNPPRVVRRALEALYIVLNCEAGYSFLNAGLGLRVVESSEKLEKPQAPRSAWKHGWLVMLRIEALVSEPGFLHVLYLLV